MSLTIDTRRTYSPRFSPTRSFFPRIDSPSELETYKKEYDPTNARFRTSICRHWKQRGFCRRGQYCNFAHGQDNLIITELPNQFHTVEGSESPRRDALTQSEVAKAYSDISVNYVLVSTP